MDERVVREELPRILQAIHDDPIDLSSVNDDSRLRDELGIDSLRAAEMLFEIEERLGVEIEDEEAARMHTVGDVVRMILAKAESGPPDDSDAGAEG